MSFHPFKDEGESNVKVQGNNKFSMFKKHKEGHRGWRILRVGMRIIK